MYSILYTTDNLTKIPTDIYHSNTVHDTSQSKLQTPVS